MNIHIVPMTAAYLSQAAALEKICFPADPWSEALFREALDTPARLLTLLRPSTSPEVIQPAGGKRQHHQEGEGGAQDIANYGM